MGSFDQTMGGDDSLSQPEASATAGSVPPRLGRYRVGGRLGRGASAVVFEAYDPNLDRNVALKVIPSELASRTAVRQIRREAQALARFSHPRVVKVFDVGEEGSYVFIASELVVGPSFRSWLEQEPRSWRQILPILLGIAEGLAAAHDQELMHGDVKPHNVMLRDGDSPVVIDFGLAHALDGPANNIGPAESSHGPEPGALDRTRGTFGTPRYMAPEVYAAGNVDARADQFGFCVMAWEALVGTAPFEGETYTELATAILGGVRVRRPAGHGVPRRLLEVIEIGLARSPDDRYRSMHELTEAMRGAGSGRHWLPAAGLTVVAVAALAVGATAETKDPQCTQVLRELGAAAASERFEKLRRRVEPEYRISIDDAQEMGRTFSRQWHGAYAEVCPDDRARTEDPRLRCLSARASALDEVLTSDGAHREPFSLAGGIWRLPSPDRCTAATSGEDELAQIHTLITEARELADHGSNEESIARLERAYELSIRNGHDSLAAWAALRLSINHGSYRQDLDLAQFWRRRAEPLMVSTSAPPSAWFYFYVYRAGAAMQGGDPERAQQDLAEAESLLVHQPQEQPIFHQVAGGVAMSRGRWDDAAAHNRAVLEGKHGEGLSVEYHSTVHNNLGVIEIRRGDTDRAIAELELAVLMKIAARPLGEGMLVDPSAALGVALSRRGRVSDAIQMLEFTLELQKKWDPKDAVGLGRARRNLALALKQAARWTEAEALLRGCVESMRSVHAADSPAVLGCQLQLGSLFIDRGDHRQARAFLEEASRAADGKVSQRDIHYHRAQLSLSKGQPEQVLAIFNAYRCDNPDNDTCRQSQVLEAAAKLRLGHPDGPEAAAAGFKVIQAFADRRARVDGMIELSRAARLAGLRTDAQRFLDAALRELAELDGAVRLQRAVEREQRLLTAVGP